LSSRRRCVVRPSPHLQLTAVEQMWHVPCVCVRVAGFRIDGSGSTLSSRPRRAVRPSSVCAFLSGKPFFGSLSASASVLPRPSAFERECRHLNGVKDLCTEHASIWPWPAYLLRVGSTAALLAPLSVLAALQPRGSCPYHCNSRVPLRVRQCTTMATSVAGSAPPTCPVAPVRVPIACLSPLPFFTRPRMARPAAPTRGCSQGRWGR